MSATAAVDESVEVDADPNAVWHALGGQGEPSWWDGMELDVCAEGSFVERWYDVDGIERFTRGRVVEVVPPRRLVLTWADDDWPSETLVTISVEALFDGRSLVRVRHEGWDGLGQVDELLSAHRYGWRHHLRAWAAAASSP